MGDNDRELGEISAKLDMLARSVDRLTNTVESMTTQGCVIGRENKQAIAEQSNRITGVELSLKRVMVAVGAIIVGGQTGIEVVKQLLMP